MILQNARKRGRKSIGIGKYVMCRDHQDHQDQWDQRGQEEIPDHKVREEIKDLWDQWGGTDFQGQLAQWEETVATEFKGLQGQQVGTG
jgi:hypothetical protein